MSWLFVLLQQLKQFILPLLVLVVFGSGDRDELWPLIGVGVLVLLSLWQYFTYRYGVAGDHLVVRSGLLERSLRVIPFARIHNVALQQSFLHRLFGVAEVRLESAGGRKPEARDARAAARRRTGAGGAGAASRRDARRRRGRTRGGHAAGTSDGRSRAPGPGLQPRHDRARRRRSGRLAGPTPAC